MYGVFFKIEALSLKNTWLPLIFLLDTKTTCLVLLSLHSFKPGKNIPVLVGTTHSKPKYLKMHRYMRSNKSRHRLLTSCSFTVVPYIIIQDYSETKTRLNYFIFF